MNTLNIVSYTGVAYKPHFDFWKQQPESCRQGFVFKQKTIASSTDGSLLRTLEFRMDRGLSDLIFRIVNNNDTGIYVTLLTGISILLHKYTSQENIIIDSPPPIQADTSNIQRVPFIIPVKANSTWKECLVSLQEIVRNTYKYHQYPFQLIDREWPANRSMFSSDILVSYNALHDHIPGGYSWIIQFEKEDNQLKALVSFAEAAFDPDFITRAWNHLQVLLMYLARPDVKITDSSIFSEEERKQILEGFNITAPYQNDKTLHRLFEEQVENTPDNTAVILNETKLTYRELNEWSNKLAHYLKETYGIKQGDIVGVLMNRSERVIVALLGILKAGAAFLPIDPFYPADRKSYMLNDAGVKVLLTDTEWLFELSFYEGEIFSMDIQLPVLTTGISNPALSGNAGDLAYVIYTSGSTGKPKGVMVAHQGVVNMLAAQIGCFGITPEDHILQFASLSFDAAVSEIFMSLHTGAALVLLEKKTIDSIELFQEYILRHEVSVITFPPSFLSTLNREQLRSVRVIITAGEAANAQDALAYSRQCAYYNAYGPTEASVCISIYQVHNNDVLLNQVPIGKPIPNMEAYVLDGQGMLVPIGLTGELYVAGAGVACGYLNNAELTAQKFVELPWMPGKRLYKTGDLVRWSASGNLEFAGRSDEQFKLRGFRIEPGEISAWLNQHAGVQESYVMKGEADELLAFVVPHRQNAAVLHRAMENKHSGKAPVLSFPDGLAVVYRNKFEAEVLYKEIFEDKVYQHAGIHLRENATIIDVGANIGMFSLYAGLHLDNARIYAFEPVEDIYQLLVENTALYNLDIKTYQAGLSDVTGTVSFTYYPNNTALSGRYADEVLDRELVRKAILNRTAGEDSLPGESLDLLVNERISFRKIDCQMCRLSDIIRDEHITEIDLLKIDVERSELEVLAGIDEEDWGKIRQLAIETDDENGKPAFLIGLLQQKGFRVVVEESEDLATTGLLNVYAIQDNWQIPDESRKPVLNKGKYWTSETALVKELEAWCQSHLPYYMVPSVFTMTGNMPLTPNGKTDKQQLLQLRTAGRDSRSTYTGPRNETERQLTELWEDILHKEQVGVHDNFFDLGGHSLKATRLVSAIYKTMKVNMDLADIFSHPTVEEQAHIIGQKATVNYEEIPALEEAPYYALSHAQRRLWILSQFAESRNAYTIPNISFLKDIDKDVLETSMNMAIDRHESLRTTFTMIEGEPMQKVHPAGTTTFRLRQVDLRNVLDIRTAVKTEVLAETTPPFDLENGPLLRGALMQLDDNEYLLILVMHHIICDGWSMHVLVKDITTIYEALKSGRDNPLTPLSVQYKDYAAWQQAQLLDRGAVALESYWLDKLQGEIPVLDMALDFQRPAVKTFNGSYVRILLDKNDIGQFKAYCQRNEASLFVGLTALTNALLYRYTEQEDIIVGTTVAGRDHADLENQSGFYVNTLPLRTTFSGLDTFDDLVLKVKESVLGAFKHQFYPFDLLVDKLDLVRDTGRSPLFDVLVELLNIDPVGNSIGTWESRHAMDNYMPDYTISKYDLSFKFDEVAEGIILFIEYNTDLFLKERVTSMLSHFQELLRSVVKNATREIRTLQYIPGQELNTILRAFNAADGGYIPQVTVCRSFEEQVEKTPGETALVFGEKTYTYLQLNKLSNQIAFSIAETGQAGPGKIIGIMLERSDLLVATVLAVMKTGAAFLFIDPAYPLQRKKYMLSDAATNLLITDTSFIFGLTDAYVGEIYAIDIQLALTEEVGAYPTPAQAMQERAYVLYTSGSTGEPKGVQISHANLSNYISWSNRYYFNNQQGYYCPLFTSLSFDLTLTSLFATLLRGDCLVVYENIEVNTLLTDIFYGKQNFGTVKLTPAHIDILREQAYGTTSIEKVIVGGEALKSHHVETLLGINPKISIYNEYGPTETTVGSTVKRINEVGQQITIGSPVANTQVYILDSNRQVLPVGVPGEIFIGGAGVAIGYYGKPALTDAVFLPDPFVPGKDRRIYKTGDAGKWLSNGEIVLVGRKDHQVKIRGYRIEPAEIEQVLIKEPTVANAVVITVPEDGTLAAFVEGAIILEPAALKRYLSDHLPVFMVPEHIVQIASIPLTQNGKTDRKQLLDLLRESNGNRDAEYRAPGNAVEKELVEIWEGVLGKERIGIFDNFFKLGGHSLKATQIIARVYQRLHTMLDISTIFLHPDIHNLALIIAEKKKTAYQAIQRVPEQEYYPVSPTQKRLWITEQQVSDLAVYNSFGSYMFEGHVDVTVFGKTLHTLIARHEILRTTFVTVNGEPRLKVHPVEEIPADINYTDLRSYENREARAAEYAEKDARAKFDMQNGPLFRVRLVQMENEQFISLFTMHHIISDGWSLNLLIKEFLILYNAFSNGRENPLTPLNIQYRDYTGWLHTLLNDTALNEHKNYWKSRFDGELPILDLPLERRRGKVKTFSGDIHTAVISKELSVALSRLSVESEASLFITLMACLKALLYRYTGQQDIIVGTVEAGRNHPDLESQIGLYVNMLAFRTRFDETGSFESLIRKVKETVLGAYEHMLYPFDQMLEDLQITWDQGRNPLFDVVISLENTDTVVGSSDNMDNVMVSGYRQEVWSSIFDLVINVKESSQGLVLHFCYNTDLFSKQFIQRFASHLAGIMQAAVVNIDTPLYALEYIPEQEVQDLTVKFNDTATVVPDNTIHGLFEAKVSQAPQHKAVIFHDRELSYDVLNRAANRLAHHLSTSLNIRPGDIVGVMMHRSELPVIAILAILKAGAAYLPIDPDYPEERKKYILADAGIKMLLLHSSSMFDISFYTGEMFAVDIQMTSLDTPDDNPVNMNKTEDPAYVIYTSGSTGLPKGVVVSHRSNVNMATDQINRFAVTPQDGMLQFASLSFDASVYEITIALLSGATLVIADRKIIQNTDTFVKYLQENKVTIATLPPAYLRILDITRLSFLRVIITAGEEANVTDATTCSLQSDYYNAYGPTEAAVCVSVYKVTPHDKRRERIPIGTPISNTQLIILDKYNQLVPVGVEGELCIAGIGLANGYLNRPALTEEKFIRHPLAGGSRLYKTGDLCKRLDNGEIEYVGRNDHQVKLRGFRIETGEITAVLKNHTGVEDAYVFLYEQQEEKRLVAFVTPDPVQAFAVATSCKAATENINNKYTLPNGLVIAQANNGETALLYEEIFLHKHYLGKHLSIRNGDVIFDVGANIGMFSLFAGLHYPDVKIFAFEPLAPVYEVLNSNAQLYDLNIKTFCHGISNQEKEVTFTYYPANTALSGQFADHDADSELIRRTIQNKAREQGQQLAEEHLETMVTENARAEKLRCRLRTLSDVIREENIQRIDFLKVDVEKSELEVLRGIDKEHWKIIRQIAVEVFDTDDCLNEITALLQEHGYTFTIEEEKLLEGTGLYIIYAKKDNEAQDDDFQPLPGEWIDQQTLKEDIRKYLSQVLPEYMCPEEINIIAQLPLNVHGKVDRKQLASLVAGTEPHEAEILPRNPYEQQLFAIWENALHKSPGSVNRNFFEIGGNSLKAAQILSAIYKKLQVSIELTEMFRHPTIAEMAQLIANGELVRHEPIPVIPEAPDYQLSHAQRRLLIEAKMKWDKQVYNLSGGYIFDKLDVTAFEQACRALVARHEILRTTFPKVNGDFRQKIHAYDDTLFTLTSTDLRGQENPLQYIRQLMEEEAARPFDLAQGPLFRARLLHLDEEKDVFLFTVHHIIFDAQSLRIAIQEILQYYHAVRHDMPVQPVPLRIQYKDFTMWQHEQLQGERLEAHRYYWLQQFSGNIPVLELPADFPRPEMKTFNGAAIGFNISGDALAGLEKIATSGSLSLFMIMQALVNLLLYRFTRQTDIVIGIAEAGRNHPDLEQQIGFYVNALPLRTRFHSSDTFMQLLDNVKENTLTAYRHAVYPFDMLVEDLQLKRDISRSALFDVAMLYEEGNFGNDPENDHTPALIKGEMISLEQSSSLHDLKFAFIRLKGEIAAQIVYNTDLFEERTIGYMKHQLEQLIVKCISNPGLTIEAICADPDNTGSADSITQHIPDVDF